MKMLKIMSILGAAAVCAISSPSFAADGNGNPQNQQTQLSPTGSDTNSAADAHSPNAKDADNTGRNVRDRNDSTLTPGDQGNSEQDIQITKRIRRSLTSDDELSTLAKNVKIITINGKTTLRGPVHSEQEKKAIETAAKKAGVSDIDNQLEIKTNNH
jgi:hyperosmotically inducible protein